MYFPSKKDIWYVIVFLSLILLVTYPILFNLESVGFLFVKIDRSITGILIATVLIALLMWFWLGTGYRIDQDKVVIKFGMLKWIVDVGEITDIEKIKNPLSSSSPALAIDKIKITYSCYSDSISISPKKEEDFVRLLLQMNPQIKADEKIYRQQ